MTWLEIVRFAAFGRQRIGRSARQGLKPFDYAKGIV
jgi:hypothetical protein